MFVKTKIESCGEEVTDFYDKGVPTVESNHTCLAVISSDSAINKDRNYYLQVFLNAFIIHLLRLLDKLLMP